MTEYKGFSKGVVVHKPNQIVLGHVVSVYQPSYDDHPYIEVRWFCNGAIGVHDAESLTIYTGRP